MDNHISRRNFLLSSAAIGLGASLDSFANAADIESEKGAEPIILQAATREIDVNGKSGTIYALLPPNKQSAVYGKYGEPFRIRVDNQLSEPTAIHWHGLHPPNNEDGVPGITQPLIRPKSSILYDFPLTPAGTHWMHSHNGFQDVRLMTAPLIVHTAADLKADEQEVVVMFNDFLFRSPEEVYAGLKTNAARSAAIMGMSGAAETSGTPMKMDSQPASTKMPGTPMKMNGKSGSMDMQEIGMPGMSTESSSGGVNIIRMTSQSTAAAPAAAAAKMTGTASPNSGSREMDLNDVNYDAYLTNHRTLRDPEVVRVEKGGRVRLRLINGSSGTNYFVTTGKLQGSVIATDGMPIVPVKGSIFPLAVAQRLDIIVQIPSSGGAFPILAIREGAVEQTGLVLATAGAAIDRIQEKASQASGRLDLGWESLLTPKEPLSSKLADSTQVLRLTGEMANYVWTINNRVFDVQDKPTVNVKLGQRVALRFINETGMSHPMHFHGHTFQIVEIAGQELNGPLRDVVLVPPRTNVTVAFDANNPGLWLIHCHLAWHAQAGMAASVSYEA
jgi:FtsP/CotA-like multicopper oxidase with cupredoxin domain